jgi:solute carrier family 25 citrate transporter 1
MDCAWKILRNEGILAFYKGLTPNLIKVFPSSGMFFLAYEHTLRMLAKP